MIGANQALSYIVFIRDGMQFAARHPGLELVYYRPLDNYVRYLFSGGLNFRPLAPAFAEPLLRLLELLLKPLNRFVALHYILIIRKRKSHPEQVRRTIGMVFDDFRKENLHHYGCNRVCGASAGGPVANSRVGSPLLVKTGGRGSG